MYGTAVYDLTIKVYRNIFLYVSNVFIIKCRTLVFYKFPYLTCLLTRDWFIYGKSLQPLLPTLENFEVPCEIREKTFLKRCNTFENGQTHLNVVVGIWNCGKTLCIVEHTASWHWHNQTYLRLISIPKTKQVILFVYEVLEVL